MCSSSLYLDSVLVPAYACEIVSSVVLVVVQCQYIAPPLLNEPRGVEYAESERVVCLSVALVIDGECEGVVVGTHVACGVFVAG